MAEVEEEDELVELEGSRGYCCCCEEYDEYDEGWTWLWLRGPVKASVGIGSFFTRSLSSVTRSRFTYEPKAQQVRQLDRESFNESVSSLTSHCTPT